MNENLFPTVAEFKESLNETIKADNYYNYDKAKVKKLFPDMSKTLKKLFDGGKVYVSSIKGNKAQIAINPADAMLGTFDVPLDVLKESVNVYERQEDETLEFDDIKDILKYYQTNFLYGHKIDKYSFKEEPNPRNKSEKIWHLEIEVSNKKYSDWFRKTKDGKFLDTFYEK